MDKKNSTFTKKAEKKKNINCATSMDRGNDLSMKLKLTSFGPMAILLHHILILAPGHTYLSYCCSVER